MRAAKLKRSVTMGEGLIGSEVNSKIQYAFRRPRFPIICAVGDELISAWSAVGFQRQIERFESRAGRSSM